ncbi:MAG TPA: ABC transporter permease [Minicystis sp.]|nr:ABC transporter permease [Minicystis sp.]
MSLAALVHGLVNVTRKELLQTLRDKRVVFILVFAPILQLTLLGYAVNLDVDHIPTVVCDEDRTEASRAVVAAIFAGDTFSRRGEVADGAAAQRELESGDAAVAFVVPHDYARRLARGDAPSVQVIVDATDAARSQVAAADATELLTSLRTSPSFAPIAPRVLYNPELKTPIYMVPGIFATLLLAVTTIATAMGLARERETGTLEQVLVTPIRPAVLLTGKLLPYLGFALLDVLAILVLGNVLFHVPIRGSLGVVGLGSLLYVLSTLGIGIFIATLPASQQQAMLGAFGFVLPAMLLSGFLTPIASMPAWLQPVTLVIPMRHFIEIMRRCLLKGATFRELVPQLGALAALGVSLLATSAALFRRRMLR